jgi:hypothetical protein
METTDNTYDVRVRIEDTADIYVGENAREAMQTDARRQLHEGIYDAEKLYEAEFDQTDIKQIGELIWPLRKALDAAKALQALAPLPPEDDDA